VCSTGRRPQEIIDISPAAALADLRALIATRLGVSAHRLFLMRQVCRERTIGRGPMQRCLREELPALS
jgi:hypothetical protein